jgi:hypothetical protein
LGLGEVPGVGGPGRPEIPFGHASIYHKNAFSHTFYRFLRAQGYDAAALRRGRLESGPAKAFEAPFVHDLWMTDFSPGPKLHLAGKAAGTHLCLILDDHSRLITHGAYYLSADSYAFHQTLKACRAAARHPLQALHRSR